MSGYPPLQKRIGRLLRGPRAVQKFPDRSYEQPRSLIDPETHNGQKRAHLSEVDVFASLSDREKDWLLHNTTMITYRKGHVFYHPDQPGEVIFILKTGRVDLFRQSEEGRKLVVENVRPHTIFGEMGFLGQRMYGCYAQAAAESLICVMNRTDMTSLIVRNPGVGLRLLADMGDRLLEREHELESLAFQALPTRLAALLLREMDSAGNVTGLAHQDLADRLGSRRETVSQILGRFRDEGLLRIESRKVCVLDKVNLERYVHR